MPTYNVEKYVAEAIESVLKQSFDDFEFIIIDDGSSDNTLKIIRTYKDKRIRLIENKHDFIGSLNIGLDVASGKYIARMDADDIMHIDRLKIQYSIMEEEKTITICSSWVSPFGKDVTKGAVAKTAFGILEHPLLHFLKGNNIFHPTVMMRTDFLRLHNLRYQNYEYAEDYKLWMEIAKKHGRFYVESQPLLLFRVSEDQISNKKREKQKKTSVKIQREILDYLIQLNSLKYSSFNKMLEAMLCAKDEQLLDNDEIFKFFLMLFIKNKNNLSLS